MIKFKQIAVVPVFGPGRHGLGGLSHETTELYALDEDGRIWRNTDTWRKTADPWVMVESPSEEAAT